MDASFLNESNAQKQVRGAADWFYWIVGITVLVMIYGFFGGANPPALGLQIPMLLAGQIGVSLGHSLLMVILMAAILIAFVLLGDAASEGSRKAFGIGISAYAIDTLLLFTSLNPDSTPLQRYGAILVHLCSVVALALGWVAAGRLEEISRSRSTVRAAEAVRVAEPADAADGSSTGETLATTDEIPTPTRDTVPESSVSPAVGQTSVATDAKSAHPGE